MRFNCTFFSLFLPFLVSDSYHGRQGAPASKTEQLPGPQPQVWFSYCCCCSVSWLNEFLNINTFLPLVLLLYRTLDNTNMHLPFPPVWLPYLPKLILGICGLLCQAMSICHFIRYWDKVTWQKQPEQRMLAHSSRGSSHQSWERHNWGEVNVHVLMKNNFNNLQRFILRHLTCGC